MALRHTLARWFARWAQALDSHACVERQPCATCATSAQTADQLRELLRSVEWNGALTVTPTHRRAPTCPLCGAFDRHAEGCRLAAELCKPALALVKGA